MDTRVCMSVRGCECTCECVCFHSGSWLLVQLGYSSHETSWNTRPSRRGPALATVIVIKQPRDRIYIYRPGVCSAWKVLGNIHHRTENSQMLGVCFGASVPLVKFARKDPDCPS